jgi:hypothetical protein
MKVYWGVEVEIHTFFEVGTRWGEWSASRPGCFTPGERTLGAHWIGGWMSPRAGLDAVTRRETPSPCRESNSGRTSPILVTILTELQQLMISRWSKMTTIKNHWFKRKAFIDTVGIVLNIWQSHCKTNVITKSIYCNEGCTGDLIN